MTTAILGKKAQLAMGPADADPVVYTTVTDLIEIGDLSVSASTVDATPYGASMYRESIAGLIDPSEISFGILGNTPSQVSTIINAYNDSTVQSVKITLPDETTLVFNAVVSGYGFNAPVDGVYIFNFNLKPTGALTYTLAA
jgi:predicted secreted protein